MRIPCFLPLVVVGCLFTACAGNNTNLAQHIFKAFNAHDWQTMLSYYADSAVFEDPAFSRPVRSRPFSLPICTVLTLQKRQSGA